MKTQTRKIYTFSELRKPAREHAIEVEREKRQNYGEIPWMDETMDSLKAVFKWAGVKMADWEIGAYSYRTHIKAEFGQEEAGELSGPRAMAWLENNLLGKLRVFSYGGTKGGTITATKKNGTDLKDALRYHHRIGSIPDCPLTGYCADDDFLDALKKTVKDGDTLKEAFEGLAQVAARAMEGELDYEMSDEGIKEVLNVIGHEFLYNGDRS